MRQGHQSIKETLQGRADDRSLYQQSRGNDIRGQGKSSRSGVVGAKSDQGPVIWKWFFGVVTESHNEDRLSRNDRSWDGLSGTCSSGLSGSKEHSLENSRGGVTFWLGRGTDV